MRRLLFVLILILCAAPALPAFAQDDKQAQANTGEESQVVLLKLMSVDAAEPIVEYLSRTLQEAIDAHPKLKVGAQVDTSINEMVLVLGCEASSTQCLSGLSDFVEGDQIVFGSIRQAEGVYLISLKQFDFATGTFLSDITDATVEGDPDAIKAGMNRIVDSLLYQNAGELEIAANGAPNAQAYFNDQKVGALPTKLEGLPLGEHTVTVETADGRRESRQVTLNRGKVAKVVINFDAPGALAIEDAPSDSSAYLVPGWASVGIGTVGLVAGIIATVQLSSYSSEADSMICGSALCPNSSASQANRLQSNMDTAYTMSIVGYSVAALGFAVGGYFLYNGYSDTPDQSRPDTGANADDSQVRFNFAPHANGASVGLGFDF